MTEYERIMNILQEAHDAELMTAKATDQLMKKHGIRLGASRCGLLVGVLWIIV